MGAQTFFHEMGGDTAGDAFEAAVKQAQWDYGHSGYTGSIAEKPSYVIVTESNCDSEDEAMELAWELIDNDDTRINDKWGPAGCIPLPDNRFLFFGWASC